MRDFDRRYALWALAVGLLLLLPAISGYAGLAWELSQFAGLLGAVGCIALCGAPLRPRDSSPHTLLGLKQHTLIGWAALAAVIAHVAGLLLADRWVAEYLKFSTPLYQAAGMLAGALLIIVVFSATAGLRRAMWKSHRGFQATHVIVGALLIALIAVHVIATDRYTRGRGRRALILTAAIGGILMLLRFRRHDTATLRAAHTRRQFVFGRHSVTVVSALVATAVSLIGLFGGVAGKGLREPLVAREHSMPLDFPHTKHVQVNCITCHHNFSDGRGFDNCVICHQSARTDLKVGIEARFHGFCLECHRHPDAAFQSHGPVSGCVACHHPAT